MSKRDLKELNQENILSEGRRAQKNTAIKNTTNNDVVEQETLANEELTDDIDNSTYSIGDQDQDINSAFLEEVESESNDKKESLLEMKDSKETPKAETLESKATQYAVANSDEVRERIYNTIDEKDTLRFLMALGAEKQLKDEIRSKILATINERIITLETPAGGGTSHSVAGQLFSQSNCTPKNVGYKKNVPIFQGKEDEDYGQWSFCINHTNKLCNFTDEEAAHAVGYQLKGTPVFYYQDYLKKCTAQGKTPSWNEIDKALSKAYVNEAKDLSTRQKLGELKSRNFANLSEYMDEFSRIAASVADMTESEKIERYIHGLERDLADRIVMQNPRTFIETIQLTNLFKATSKKQININYVSKQIN